MAVIVHDELAPHLFGVEPRTCSAKRSQANGDIEQPVVVGADPQGIFEDAALKAIARWRYNPRIDGGVAVERVGLQTVIRFELNK